MIFAEI